MGLKRDARSRSRFVAAILTAMILVGGGSWLIVSYGVGEALRKNAKITAGEWADYLATAAPALEAVLEGKPLEAGDLAFFEKAQRVGKIFRYKLFDPGGILRLDSADLGATGAVSLSDHNPKAANVVLTGMPYLESEQGNGIDRPLYYAEAYYPLLLDDTVIGTIEVYVDQTERNVQLRKEFAMTALAIAAISALSFLLPAAAFFWRSRQHRDAQDALAYAAHHDELTGLLNRNAFRDKINAQIDGLKETTDRFRVLFVDLDRFKDVNDTRGHAIGDELLRRIATRLSRAGGDTGFACRLGGDEFALIETHPTGTAENSVLAGSLIADLGRSVRIRTDEIKVGASIGVAEYPRDGSTAFDLLKAADFALYEAKRLGRGRHCHYERHMEARRAARLAIEERVRTAVETGNFEIHYQPIYASNGAALCGYEALMRLTDVDGEMISPGAFIPVAEETELIVPLGEQMLLRACNDALGWNKRLTLSVNLSPVQFRSGDLVGTVRAALDASGLAPERLELEITESILIADPDMVALQFDQLKELGVSIALDDFGTGYSSLSYLWRFPFDKLKIDRSFINNLDGEDPRSRQILETVVALGEVLRLEITAEGVETSKQAAQIGAMNIDLVQGFFFGVPAPIGELRPEGRETSRAS